MVTARCKVYRTNERIFAIMHHICRYSSFYTISSTGTVKRQMDEVGRDLRELRLRSVASQHT